MGKDGAGARSTRFVRDNLALLGFGGRKDALVQAVKELFENGARGGEQGHWVGG
jgi:DNA topoisomerase VI subunit B